MHTTTYAAASSRGRTVALAALAALSLAGAQAETAQATSGDAMRATPVADAGTATVVIRKVADPAAGAPSFAFAGGGPAGAALPTAATFALEAGESLTREVVAGTPYAVAEDQAAEAAHGYTLTAVGGDGCVVAGPAVVVTPQAGETVTCTFVSERDRPGLSVHVAGPAIAAAGDALDFTYAVENTGNVPVHGVTLADDACAPVTGPADGAGEDGGVLLPGEQWSGSCSSTMPDAGTVAGVVTATAAAADGATVTATGHHITMPTSPAGDDGGPSPGTGDGGGPAPPTGPKAPHHRGEGGHAQLHGPVGCTSGTALAVVRGRRIGRVEFRLDGRRVATVRRADRRGRWSARVGPGRHRGRTHHLSATVTFAVASGERTRTLRSSFSRCRATSVRLRTAG